MGFKRFLTMLVVMLSLLCFSNSVMAKEDLSNLFTDYTHTKVNEDWTQERVANKYKELDENDPNMKDIKRALSILSGVVEEKNEQYERSTSNGSIEKTGDIRSHMHDELKLRAFSTNSQSMGLNAKSGTTIKVFAQNLPENSKVSICFEQILADHYGTDPFLGNTYLHNGENDIYVPTFTIKAETGYVNYKTIQNPMIYIRCPYDQETLPEDFSLYFEGVKSHPVYHMDKEDPEEFKSELRSYTDKVNNDPENVIDVMELVSQHTIMAVRATRADELLSQSNYDVNRSLDAWDYLFEFMYKFDGIDDTNDKLAQNAKEYFTVVQQGHGAYMYTGSEYIGVHAEGEGEDGLIDCYKGGDKPAIGWGYSHEVGHAIDNESRVLHECTNNLFANAYHTWVNHDPSDGSVDPNNKRNKTHLDRVRTIADPNFVKGSLWNNKYYENGNQNYLVFSLLESYHPGFWGEVDSYYRDPTNKEELNRLYNKSERMVYVSSKVLNCDLGYWFEDFGLNLTSYYGTFTVKDASDTYHQMMEDLKATPGFINKEIPFWFLDVDQYMLAYENHANKNWGNLYGENGTESSRTLSKPLVIKGSDDKYQLIFTDNKNEERLLYEVYLKDGNDYQSLGQTYNEVFSLDNDPSIDDIYVRALDRKLNWSEYTKVEPEDSPSVAKIGTQTYPTLSEAIKAALDKSESNVTIILTNNTVLDKPEDDDYITINNNKTITLQPEGDITVYQVDKARFNIEGATLTVNKDNGNLTFQGLENQNISEALFTLGNNGNLNLTNINVRDWQSLAVSSVIDTGNSTGGTVQVTGCNFINCGGGKGAIKSGYNLETIQDTCTQINLSNCKFTECFTTNIYSGGALTNNDGKINAQNCTFINCSGKEGGAVWSSGNTNLTECSFIGCEASSAGGAIYVSSVGMSNIGSIQAIQATGITTINGGTFYSCNSPKGTILAVSGENLKNYPADNQELLVLNNINVAESNSNPIALSSMSGQQQSEPVETVFYSSIGKTTLKGTTSFGGNIELNGGKFNADSNWTPSNLNITIDSPTSGQQLVICDSGDSSKITNIIHLNSDLQVNYVGDDSAIEIAAIKTHNIEYDLNGGSWVGIQKVSSYQEGIKTKLPTNVKKDNKTFVGWFKESNFDSPSVREVGLPDDTEDISLKAKWAGDDLEESCEHKWNKEEKITIEADCTHAGYKSWTLTCENCYEEKIEEETTSKTNHKYDEPLVNEEPASCTNYGLKTITRICSICQHKETTTETLYPTGHSFGSWKITREPTSTTTGIRTQTCSKCGQTNTETIPATGSSGSGSQDSSSDPPPSGGGSSSSGGSGGSGNNNPPATGGGGNTPSVSPGSGGGGGSGSMPVTPPSSDSGNSNDNKDVAVTGVTVTPTSGTIEIGETLQLRATVTPNNATDKTVTWSSKDSTIASVNQAGLVTAKAAGTTKITVTTKNGNKTAVCSITVKTKENSDSPSTKPETPSQPVQPSQPNQPVQPSQPNQPAPQQSMPIYRLYNAANNEHLYTSDAYEVSVLAASGWTDEGVGWSAPATGEPVYRLYSPVTNEHHYTKDTNEVSVLKNSGWSVDNGERPLFYSGGNKPVYRLYHEGTKRHHLTTDESEYNILGNSGWNQEGIALQSLS